MLARGHRASKGEGRIQSLVHVALRPGPHHCALLLLSVQVCVLSSSALSHRVRSEGSHPPLCPSCFTSWPSHLGPGTQPCVPSSCESCPLQMPFISFSSLLADSTGLHLLRWRGARSQDGMLFLPSLGAKPARCFSAV